MIYNPTIPPNNPAELPGFLLQELANLRKALEQPQPYVFLDTLSVAPIRPREGMVVKADGTNWNPGSGAGVYAYVGGAWVKL